jgi:tripartite ATP-independent transporter DctM subunit
MGPFATGILGCLLMMVFFALGMPIGFTLGIVGFLGLFYVIGLSAALSTIALKFYASVSDYNFTLLPLFILMGAFANVSGMSRDLFETADKWLRRLPGGICVATIAGCAGFAAVCGSNVATSATMGTVALPEMKRLKYDDSLATGTVASAGTLGFLIPPSVGFVVYGILAEQSIGKLLVSGILPGILMALIFVGIVVVQVELNPAMAPRDPQRVTWKEKLLSLRNVWSVLVTFVLVMGGIWLGYFTPTEAGSVGAAALFLIAIIRGKLSRASFSKALKETIQTTSMIFIIIMGTFIFSDFLAVSELPLALASWITSLGVSRYLVLAFMVGVMLILGCLVDCVPMLMISMPILFPISVKLGFNPIWFGVLCVLMMNAALLTPPVGLCIYTVAGLSKGTPITTVFRGSMPFLVGILAVSLLLVFFPDLALFLPGLMK